MDAMAMIIPTVPIIYPVIVHLGFDPIWFGVIIVMTVELGLIHPRGGMNVFVIKSVVKDVSFTPKLQGRAAVHRDRHRAAGDPDRFPPHRLVAADENGLRGIQAPLQPRKSSPPVRVEFGDCDPAGIVGFPPFPPGSTRPRATSSPKRRAALGRNHADAGGDRHAAGRHAPPLREVRKLWRHAERRGAHHRVA
ncbi:tripartite ATP-independent periplasmic transporter, dctM component domain-containing protein [Ditylenchus destructor]|uniref:Tripartite ATP-independent periplasmic transporter, dctM component domain-containing protein n=1 Tax=Ditylenchus destructor TaxID=166010 RepID=A0AAD4MIE1_9BILA|nr:tripartite ATP-independent periplasmic transporter, dctM component domain-containing protein [Ditylenchus destructor]